MPNPSERPTISDINERQSPWDTQIKQALENGASEDEAKHIVPPRLDISNVDIWNKLIDLENKIDKIFGKSVLINGRWVQI